MIQDDYRAAIDVGTTKVCTILGKRHHDDRVELAGFGVAPCSGLRRGVVSDADATAEAVRASVAEASAQAGMPIKRAYVGLTGSHVESENRWRQVPHDAGIRTITESDLNAALTIAGGIDVAEGRKLLHAIPRSYALDGVHGVRNPLGMHASQLHIQSHLVTGSIEHMESLKAAVSDAGVAPGAVVVDSIACADAVIAADEREDGVILLDIGGGTTDLSVFFDGAVVHTSVLPIGGYQFTNDLRVAFATSYQEAERLKCQFGTATPELVGMTEEIAIKSSVSEEQLMITRREIGQVLSERVRELFDMVKLKLDVPHVKEQPINRMVLTGGGAKLEGLEALARYLFQRQVRLANPRGIQGLMDHHTDPAYSAAVGILLWGMRNLPIESHVSIPIPGSAASARRFLSSARTWVPGFGRSAATERTPAGAGT